MSEQSPHTYGIWEVWRGEFPEPGLTPEEIAEEYELIGIFRGHVDDIAFGLTGVRYSDWKPYLFRRADPDAQFQDVSSLPKPTEDVCLVDVELEDGSCVSWEPENIPAYFEHREVLADMAPHTGSMRVSQLASPFGKEHAVRKARLESILAKLTREEREVLHNYGLVRNTY
jgi:hypothetical protein